MSEFLTPPCTNNLAEVGDLVGGVQAGESFVDIFGTTNWQSWTATQIKEAIDQVQNAANYQYCLKANGNDVDTGINSFSKMSTNSLFMLSALKRMYEHKIGLTAIEYSSTYKFNTGEKAFLDGVTKISKTDDNLGNSFTNDTYWKTDSSSAGNKKFSINSGADNFITSSNNNTITINGSTTPLVYTYANGISSEQTDNQSLSLDQNGSFLIGKNDSGNFLIPETLNFRANSVNTKNTLYRLLNQMTNATANFSSGSSVISNVAGIDWTKVVAGQTITSAITGLATSFTLTGTTTSGNATITGVVSTLWSSIFKGQVITGSGIPTNTIITNFDQNAGTITLSANATGGGTSAFTLSASPKVASFNQGTNTITLDLPCTANTTSSAIQVHSDVDLALATSYFKVGMAISGTNIPASSTIASIDPTIGSITLNNNATATTTVISGLTASQTGFYEATTAPSTANNEELWVNMNPLKTYKRISGSWAESYYILLGSVVKSNGVIGSTRSLSFDGLFFGEKTQPYNNFSLDTKTGSKENTVLKYGLLCINATAGYTVGKFYPALARTNSSDGAYIDGYNFSKDIINIASYSSNWGLTSDSDSTTGDISSTNANFKFVVTVQRSY